MKIIYPEDPQVSFEHVHTGSTFTHAGSLFLRVDKRATDFNAIRLDTGVGLWFGNDVQVKPVKAHIVIES